MLLAAAFSVEIEPMPQLEHDERPEEERVIADAGDLLVDGVGSRVDVSGGISVGGSGSASVIVRTGGVITASTRV